MSLTENRFGILGSVGIFIKRQKVYKHFMIKT